MRSTRIHEIGGAAFVRADRRHVEDLAERDDATQQRAVTAHRHAETQRVSVRLVDADLAHEAERVEVREHLGVGAKVRDARDDDRLTREVARARRRVDSRERVGGEMSSFGSGAAPRDLLAVGRQEAPVDGAALCDADQHTRRGRAAGRAREPAQLRRIGSAARRYLVDWPDEGDATRLCGLL
jgi:hypothetical protein